MRLWILAFQLSLVSNTTPKYFASEENVRVVPLKEGSLSCVIFVFLANSISFVLFGRTPRLPFVAQV